ncbi:MAG: GTP-binding protein HSR1, partial [Planctomycetes bacterium]|nr:GTP-binding protein HSR1 [Planctomycetota bacterium]
MAANLTPAYRDADERFRNATTNEEKIAALEEMIATVPKHKGTEGLQADLKRKLSHFREAATQQKKSGGHVDIFHVPRSGAGQVVLLGMPNVGKSSILATTTKAKVVVADFPFATQVPVPGMLRYEDVQIQLVDMPPITADYSAPGQVGTYRNGDLIALVIDLSQDVEEQILVLMEYLESRKLLADGKTPAVDSQGNAQGRKAVCLCTKADLAAEGAFELVKASCDKMAEFLTLSTQTGEGYDKLGEMLFRQLNI